MIALLGGSGFIGEKLCEVLHDQELVFTNFDIVASKKFGDDYRYGDVTELKNFDGCFVSSNQIINLAAEHKDNVKPINLYYDVNVEGAKETVRLAEKHGITKIIFTSSAAVYGLHNEVVSETTSFKPFNHYGKSKLQAEKVYLDWQKRTGSCLIIIRPTVVFGEGNRGNVYNLFRQMNEGNFLMVGNGENRKSMAYVGNIVAFIKHCVEEIHDGLHIYNYSDGPDLTMNQLVEIVTNKLSKEIPSTRIPFWVGMTGGYMMDFLSLLTGREFPISSVRVKKFCANTQFSSELLNKTGFKRPYTLEQGLEMTLNYEFGRLAHS